MLTRVGKGSLAAIMIGGSMFAIDVSASAQAVIHPIGHYSGERMHSEFWREHYRQFSKEDRSHDDNAVTAFDHPIGEGVR